MAFDAGNTSRDIAADLARGGGRGVRRAAARLLVVAARPRWRASPVAGPASAHVGGGAAGSDFDGAGPVGDARSCPG